MTSHGVTILRVGGVPVRLDVSWLLIAVAVVWSLSGTLADPARSTVATIGVAVLAAAGFFASILAHEIGHALAARRRDHDVHGITLFVFGGLTEMDADTRTWQDEFVIAAVGPWVSLNLAALLGLVTAGLDWFSLAPTTATVLGMLGWLNLALAVFNLVPGAPLDGGRVLRALAWPVLGSRRRASRVAAAMGIVVGTGLWALAAVVATSRRGALLSALWLTLVAAFIVAIAFGQWRAARPGLADDDEPGPDELPAPAVVGSDRAPADATVAAGDGTGPEAPAAPRDLAGVPAAPPDLDGPDLDRPSADDHPPDPSGRPPPLPPRPRWARWTIRVASSALVLGGLLVVPMPVIERSPGPTFDLGPTLEVSGATTPLDGEFVVLTVFLRQPGIAEVLRARWSEHRTLTPIGEVVGPDGSTRDYFSGQSQLFASAFEQAAAAALEAAGEDVEVVQEVVIGTVLPDAPAADVLAPGDVVVAVDGVPVATPDELAARTAEAEAGQVLDLTIRRDDRERDVGVTVDLLPGGERVGLGITVGIALGDLSLPREVDHSDLRVGGPSAGLVTSLAIYDLVADEDLLAGRTVAVTGTMAIDGTVGAIGGVPEKVEGAVAADAELLLVPLAQQAEFEAASAGRVPVVGVATLDGAIAALRGA